MGIIIFNKQSSEDYHIRVEHLPGYEIPEKDYDIVHVPGRNGDVVLDSGSYKNVDRQYELSVGSLEEDFISMAEKISSWLHSASGYARLEDSYEPQFYRMALYKEQNNIENILNHAGRVTVKFNCKPQKWLKNGENAVSFETSGGIINGQTLFTAYPTITVYGSGAGTLSIGQYNVEFSKLDSSLTIDSVNQSIVDGIGVNRSNYVKTLLTFPRLVPGENAIKFTGGIQRVEVIPKWWTI